MHDRREGLKGQEMFFVLHQAAHRFGIDLAIFAFEGCQLHEGLLFRRRLPDPSSLRGNGVLLSFGDGIHHIALFMDHAALARRGRKEGRNRCEQAVMPIGHDQIDLGRSVRSQILEHIHPPIFAFLSTRTSCEHLFVPL